MTMIAGVDEGLMLAEDASGFPGFRFSSLGRRVDVLVLDAGL